MRISRAFLLACALAFSCALPLPAFAADTEAQIRARDALEKKMQELQSQQPQPPAKTPVVAPPKKTQKTKAPPPARSEPPRVESAPVTKQSPPVSKPPPTTAPVAKTQPV